METCAWCNAPRGAGPKCPSCGADYAKAEQIRRQGKAVAVPAEVVPATTTATPAAIVGIEDRLVEDPAAELKITIIAPPAALALGLAFHFLLPSAQRIFFGMPVHELGHATTAWLCGFPAIPTLWKTPVFDRTWIMSLALAGLLGYAIFRASRAGKPLFAAAAAVVLLVQAAGTLGTSERSARMLIAFGGDGMGMVLAVALMATFFFGKGTQLYKGWTRWGLLVIGAAAFADMSGTWFAALRDRNAIPFGENEGSGLSDPLRLIEEYRWTTQVLVRRYVMVAAGSMAALAAIYAWAVLRARRYANQPT